MSKISSARLLKSSEVLNATIFAPLFHHFEDFLASANKVLDHLSREYFNLPLLDKDKCSINGISMRLQCSKKLFPSIAGVLDQRLQQQSEL